ncbi:MAG: nucleoside recognition domain-containing protein [Pseudomonadota bacterium]
MKNPKKAFIPEAVIRTFHDAARLSFDLFKIMVPIIIVIKIVQELGLIPYLAVPLAPVMEIVGLPGEMGLVWATAILNNLYGAMIVLISLAGDAPLTTAQSTVLCTMMLVAHSLPLELKIAQASGPRLLFQAVSRLGSAMTLGWLLHFSYTRLGLSQEPMTILFQPGGGPAAPGQSLLSWASGEVRNLIAVFLIILALFLLMRLLQKWGVIDLMNRVLRPLLKGMGIGPKASAIAVIGLTLGISYGGGFIIQEAKSGRIDKKDVFFCLTLMGLSHSLVEDTLLMMMVGGHLSGLLFARLIFSFLFVALIVKATVHLPQAFCDRFLWGEPRRVSGLHS